MRDSWSRPSLSPTEDRSPSFICHLYTAQQPSNSLSLPLVESNNFLMKKMTKIISSALPFPVPVSLSSALIAFAAGV
jgi:hypothetical protein